MPSTQSTKPHASRINRDLIVVENIQCVDSKGNVMERYDEIFVPTKPVMRTTPSGRGSTAADHATFYDAIDVLKERGQFLPSLPLTVAIVRTLAEQVDDDPIFATVLQQYKGNRSIYGKHIVNTIYNSAGEIIHYPDKKTSQNAWIASSHRISMERASFEQPHSPIVVGNDVLKPYDAAVEGALAEMVFDEPYKQFLIDMTGTLSVSEDLTTIANAVGNEPTAGYFYDSIPKTVLDRERLRKHYVALMFGSCDKFVWKSTLGISSGGCYHAGTTFRGVGTQDPRK